MSSKRYRVPQLNRTGLSKILHVTAKDGVPRNLLSGNSIGSNLNVSNCANAGGGLAYITFANDTPTGFDAISDGSSTQLAGTADEISFVSGQKYVVTFDMVLNSGTAPKFGLRTALAGTAVTSDDDQDASAGANVFEFTCNSTTTGLCRFYNLSTATNYQITNLSVKKYIPEVVNTLVSVKKDSQQYIITLDEVATSKIDAGGYHTLLGDITCIAWVSIYHGGHQLGTATPRFIDSGSFIVYKSSGSNQIAVERNYSTVAYSANTIIYDEYMCIIVTSTAAGVTNIYIDGKLSGGADQSAGTPTTAATNIIIGNRNSGSRAWAGRIGEVIVLEGLMTPAEISQYYTATKHKYLK